VDSRLSKSVLSMGIELRMLVIEIIAYGPYWDIYLIYPLYYCYYCY